MDAAAIEQTLRELFARDPHGAAAVYLFGSQAARVVVPVREDDDRAPASLALGDSPGGLRDRIVQ